LAIHRQRSQKSLYFWFTHFSGMAFGMEKDVSFGPLHIRLFGSQAVMLQAQTIPNLVE